MNRKVLLFPLAIALAFVGGCSSGPPKEAAKPVTLDKIQGRAQVVTGSTAANDLALSAGGPSIYIWDGVKRYRLFVKSPVDVKPDQQYAAEGIDAQKMIDSIGDPDKGANGYPLPASCDRVIAAAWPGLAFDVADGNSSVLRNTIKRYPARDVFLVVKLTPVEGEAKKDEDADAPELTVPADKQKAQLVEGPSTLPAPLWDPKGDTVKCKITIGTKGKVSALDTGNQLCEAVPWEKYSYKPAEKGGKPAVVKTEVEVTFTPQK